jgi:hypothetical protein
MLHTPIFIVGRGVGVDDVSDRTGCDIRRLVRTAVVGRSIDGRKRKGKREEKMF